LVADYVKTHIEEISQMTIGDLAQGCGVSKPTVIRFCRTLGAEGFPDFKLRLAQNLAVSAPYMSSDARTLAKGGDNAVDHVLNAVYSAVDVMRNQLDHEMLAAAEQALSSANQILFAGIGGGSSSIAQEAANRFFRLGIPSFNVSDSYVLQMRAATLKPGDVLFLISASGEANAIVNAAEIAAGYGATTICVTKSGTRLARSVQIPVLVNQPELGDIYKPTASRYIHLIIVDALAMAVARSKSDQVSENLRRIRASLTAYHGRTELQPLGD